MKKRSLYYHCAIVGFCAAVAITPLSLSAQTSTNPDGSTTTSYSDQNRSGTEDRKNYSWLGLIGLLGLTGLVGRNRNDVHGNTTRTDLHGNATRTDVRH